VDFEEKITEGDLALAIDLTHQAAATLEKRWGIRVLSLVVDPQELYEEERVRWPHIYAMRRELELLRDLLSPMPEEAAREIMRVFAASRLPQVVIIHSQSMFSGKTSVLYEIAKLVGFRYIFGFQPQAAVRWEKQKGNIVTRDGGLISAESIESDDLADVLKYVKNRQITPENRPYIFIDEIMLFTKTAANCATQILEELRNAGFHVVVTGIDYTFQEEPFTFMHNLLGFASSSSNWHQVEMSTRCKYCGQRAAGSRRIKPNGEIAHFEDAQFEAGDHYEPVCLGQHKSCVGQPMGFRRRLLPLKR